MLFAFVEPGSSRLTEEEKKNAEEAFTFRIWLQHSSRQIFRHTIPFAHPIDWHSTSWNPQDILFRTNNYAIFNDSQTVYNREMFTWAQRMWRMHKSFTPFEEFSAVRQTMLSKTCWEWKDEKRWRKKWTVLQIRAFFLLLSFNIHIYIWIKWKIGMEEL